MPDINILLRATDEASGKVAEAGNQINTSLDRVTESSKRVFEAQATTEINAKKLVTGFSGLATGAFALYNAFDNVLDMQVSVDKANLQVKSTLNSLEDAQRRYNTAVEKYGEDSEEALSAASDLSLAQERYGVAVERADMVQGNFNERIVQSALSVVPIAITMVTSLGTAFTAMGMTGGIATMAIDGVSMALSFLAAHPIVLAIMAIVAALVILWNYCPQFREAVIALGQAIATWFGDVWNSIRPTLEAFWNNVLVPFGNWLSGVFGVLWNALCTGISVAYNSYILPVWNALQSVWNNVLVPLGNFLIQVLLAQFSLLWNTLNTVYNSVVVPIWNALQSVWNNVLVPLGNFLIGTLLGAWNTLTGGISSAYNSVVKPVWDGLKWVWDNLLVPLGNFIGGALLNAWKSFASGLQWAYNTFIKPVIDALKWAYDNVIKPVANALGVGGGSTTTASTTTSATSGVAYTPSTAQSTGTANYATKKVPVMAEGGYVMEPTLALIGEAGPEAVVPLGKHLSGLSINGPLVVVEGSADERTARLAAELVMEKVRRLIQA